MRLFLTWIYGTFKRTKYPAFYRVVNTAREFTRDFYMRTRFFSLDMTTRNEETKINIIHKDTGTPTWVPHRPGLNFPDSYPSYSNRHASRACFACILRLAKNSGGESLVKGGALNQTKLDCKLPQGINKRRFYNKM